MSAIASTVQTFFTEYLMRQRQASPHTIAAYRDLVRMLLFFAAERTGIACHQLQFTDVDAGLVTAFLDDLEHGRGNSVRTRNARLAGIHSLFGYAATHHPEHAEDIQRVLAIPAKRAEHTIITYLTEAESEALLAAPNRNTRTGRRDHALLQLAIQTGLRASELTSLTRRDIHLGTGAHIRCRGKGRKHRITPLTHGTVTVMRTWIRERTGDEDDPLFPTNRGSSMSPDALAQRVRIHASTAARSCRSLASKNVTPHVLRHTAAMRLLHAGVDTTVIALWLGHVDVTTTQIYLEADLVLKQRALDRTTPPKATPGRYRPPDQLIAFLEAL
ncbi:tyrosine-type recombinase/integrase [Amycolatopsis cihanbeyliensis]|uniref:Site-specific recombinase XerD n=1 Tax=Amycolatopsis cihanbeyliensis TaxID=1128664 RepID=A0A542DEX6_AMYCI|nr:tyrosine-type recombinase/integrase [Amycolatopsis cihanbeyliensis]TQJ01631.1 site-specific recombinase XerD [Amycolatopsis cihanbeyliensis]TQJ03942.1 site-specific recombinase XerD [Amycolatopsis cihanbeyliensis]